MINLVPMRLAPIVVILVFVSACYKYEPLEQAAVTPQTMVRARLSTAEAEQIKDLVQLGDRVVSGKVIEADAARLLLELPSTTRNAGATLQTLHQRVSISRAGIIELESKQLDKGKTALVTAAGIAAIGAILFSATVLDPGKEGSPPEIPGPEFRIRLGGARR